MVENRLQRPEAASENFSDQINFNLYRWFFRIFFFKKIVSQKSQILFLQHCFWSLTLLRSQKSGRRPDFTKNAFFHQKINFFKKSKSGRRPEIWPKARFRCGWVGGASPAPQGLSKPLPTPKLPAQQHPAGYNKRLSPQGVDSQNLRM